MKNETPCNVRFRQFYQYFASVLLSLVRVPFLCRNIVELYRLFLQFLEHHAVCLKDLFEFSNNFNAPLIHEASRTFQNVLEISGIYFYFYYSGDPAKFRNHDLRTSEKRGVTVFSNTPLSRPFRYNVRIPTIIFFLILSQFPVIWLQYHPLSDVCNCLFNVFTPNSVAGVHLLHQSCENCPSHRDSEPTL